MVKSVRFILVLLLVAAMGCHRTAPQSPSLRSNESPQADSATIALMEMNRRMVDEADRVLMHMADSITKATGREFAQMGCGGWKSRRTDAERNKGLFLPTPNSRERWRVRLRTFRLDGRLATDTESEYTIKQYNLPISVEEALEGMYTGEKVTVLSPWYCSYGIRGNEYIAPYESVIFEITLGECTFVPFDLRKNEKNHRHF